MCLCVDLILTIYDPFSPAGRRTKLYYFGSLVTSTCLIIFIYVVDAKYNTSNDTEIYCIKSAYYSGSEINFIRSDDKSYIVLEMTLSLYTVVAIYSTVYSYRRLHRPGVSAPARSLFVKKHLIYVVVFTLLWSIEQSNH